MKQSRTFWAALLTALILVAGAASARAEVIPVVFQYTVDGETTTFQTLEGTVNPDDTFSSEGAIRNDDFELEWSIDGDMDPVLTVGIAVVDVGAPSVFGFLFQMPVLPNLPPPTVTSGSIGGSITDHDGDGTSISSTGGQAVYTALINGTPFQTLMDDPYLFSSGLAFGTATVPVEDFGLPGVTFPGPGVTVTDMGILITFQGSGGGDATAFTANFVLLPTVVPEPATIGLLGLGLAGMAARGLRRRLRG